MWGKRWERARFALEEGPAFPDFPISPFSPFPKFPRNGRNSGNTGQEIGKNPWHGAVLQRISGIPCSRSSKSKCSPSKKSGGFDGFGKHQQLLGLFRGKSLDQALETPPESPKSFSHPIPNSWIPPFLSQCPSRRRNPAPGSPGPGLAQSSGLSEPGSAPQPHFPLFPKLFPSQDTWS